MKLYARLFIAILFSLIGTISVGQYMPISSYDISNEKYICDKPQILNIDTLIAHIQQKNIVDTALLACYYHQIGFYYYSDKKDFIKSLAYNIKASDLRFFFNDGLYWKSLRNIAFCYKKLNEYHSAVNYFELALNNYQDKDVKNKEAITIRLAEVLYFIGEYERSKNLVDQIVKTSKSTKNISKAYKVMSEAIIYLSDSVNFNLAIQYGQKAVELSERDIPYLNTLANAYNINEKFNKAIEIYNEILQESNKLKQQFQGMGNIATAYTELEQYKRANKFLVKSLNLKLKYYDKKINNYNLSVTYRSLANNYSRIQQLDSALFFYHKALLNLSNQFKEEDIFKNPNPTDTLYIYSKLNLIEILDLKATTAYKYYIKKQDENYINLAHQTYQTLLDFHNQLQQDISTENSRLLQTNKIVPFIEKALEIVYTKQLTDEFNAEATFRLIEKNKATVLSQLMNEADALQFTNLPDSLIEKEKDLKIAIAFYERRLNEAKKENNIQSSSNERNEEIKELELLVFENKESYHRLIRNLEENYPYYLKFKYQQNESTLTEVQNHLDEETALLEYFVGDSIIYLLTIQKDSARLHLIAKPENWTSIISNFRKSISDQKFINSIDSAQAAYQLFTENSYTLFQLLLEKPLAAIGNTVKHLQIIPDGELNYIPFDLLLTSKENTNSINYKNLPYLLKDKSIGYAYSAALLLENENKKSDNKKDSYLGFAPIYEANDMTDLETQLVTRGGNINLPFAQKSVEAMYNLFGGKAYLAKEATKSNFLSDTNTYKVLHLAMHGIVDDKNPLSSKLIFYGDSLYASELYNTKLNADLAVLSACNTGIGNIQKGEGVMSLSRAFTYAGCPSLVMSLWSVPDESTSDVIQFFFKALKNGATKDEALRSAKLNYLDNNETTSHPIYWAGFVATGNLEAIQFETGFNWWWALLAIPLVVLVFYVQSILKNRKLLG